MAYSRQNFILLGTVILAFTAFCVETDIYTPSFPDMVAYFGTSESYIQHILTANFVGLFLSTLLFGPLSDCYGRKRLLCAGLGLFAVSSIACMMVTTVDQLIFWRFAQGMGGGAVTGICTAMVFDAFPKETSARLIAVLNSFVTGIMALAPLVGSWVNIYFGWRMNFAVIAVLAALSFLATFFLVKETHPVSKRTPLKVSGILKEYHSMLSNLTFITNTLIWTIMFGLMMVFVSNLSLIYIDHLNVSESIFGFYQASIMTAFFVGSLVASQCIAKLGMEKTKHLGNILFAIGAIGLVLLVFLGLSLPLALTLLMGLVSAGMALCCTIYYVNAMADFPHATGTLAALSQGLRLVISAGMIGLSSKLFTGSMAPVAYITGVSFVLIVVLYQFSLKEMRKRIIKNMACKPG
jgi:DHA1 family bicyclomycin/chloramphenicol resistance-like MFS transporter